jgi:hypothetical protein
MRGIPAVLEIQAMAGKAVMAARLLPFAFAVAIIHIA